ncbi:hypothetical protein NX059_010915 [Plenodomus lindquistii]|nr:hypothetical protein NX059_010915 [Plenodomus lindquistii]
MMGEIYRRASCVISWLGPEDDDSKVAIPLMRRLLSLPQAYDMITNEPSYLQGSLVLTPRHIPSNGSALAIIADASTSSLVDENMDSVDAVETAHYGCLARFLARRYFFRCWVLQEIMFARELQMLCGTQEVQHSDLNRVASVVSSLRRLRANGPIAEELSLPILGPRSFEHEQAVRKLWHYRHQLVGSTLSGVEPKSLPFANLLALSRISGCQDPKDKVYSLLGLVNRSAFRMTPDYGKPVAEIYSYATRYWINETRSLNCLSWVLNETSFRKSEFPSWIGEFEDTFHQEELAFTTLPYKATLDSRIAPLIPLGTEDFRTLPARGLSIDCIAELATTFDCRGFTTDYRTWNRIVLQLPLIYPFTGQARGEVLFNTVVGDQVEDVPFNSLRDNQDFKARVRKNSAWIYIRELHRWRWYTADGSDPVSYAERALDLLRTLDAVAITDNSGFVASWHEVLETETETCTCNARLSYLSSSEDVQQSSPDLACPYVKDTKRRLGGSFPHSDDAAPDLSSSPNSVPDAHNWKRDFISASDLKLYSRLLARTEKGYLALVPAGSKVGDAVWLLQGARVPFVLRKAVDTEVQSEHIPDDTEKRWTVVGDAYVHGVMQGEVWKSVQEEHLEDIKLV